MFLLERSALLHDQVQIRALRAPLERRRRDAPRRKRARDRADVAIGCDDEIAMAELDEEPLRDRRTARPRDPLGHQR